MTRKYLFSVCSLLFFSLSLSSCQQSIEREIPSEWGLLDYKQRYHQLAEYRGRWVIINFWATWCPPCLKEIPALQRFHDAPNNAVVWGLNMESAKPKKLQKFIQAHGISYPIFPDVAGQSETMRVMLREYFPMRGLPTTYIVNPAGKIVKRLQGEVTEQQLTRFISKMEQH